MKLKELWELTTNHIFFTHAHYGKFTPSVQGLNWQEYLGEKEISDYYIMRIEPGTFPNYGNVLKVYINKDGGEVK